MIAHEVLWFGLVRPIARFLLGHHHNGLRRIGYFTRGLAAGLRTPVDVGTMLYIDDTRVD